MRLAASALVALALVAPALVASCRRRGRDEDAPPAPPPVDRPAPRDAAPDVGHERPREVSADQALVSDAVSEVRAVAPGDLRSVALRGDHDLSHVELRALRWRGGRAEVLATKTVSDAIAGAAVALLRRDGGLTAVWFNAPVDGGQRARALDLAPDGAPGDERDPTAAELAGAAWAQGAVMVRRRAGINDVAPEVTVDGVTARVDPRTPRRGPAVMLGEVTVTEGADLSGWEPSLGLGVAPGGRRWVAVSRGRCAATRVELYRVDDAAVTLRARWMLGAEVGVRWIRVDATRDEAVVSWYQTLVPLRVECVRAPGGATVEDHGLRVAVARAEGDPVAPMPDADAALDAADDAAVDAAVDAARDAR